MKEWTSLLTDLKEAGPISIPRSYNYRVATSYTLCDTLCGFLRCFYQSICCCYLFDTEVKPSNPKPYLDWSYSLLFYSPNSSPQWWTVSPPRCPRLCYTDSLVALFWIRGTNKEKSVKFVTEATLIVGVSSSNPADLPSRGLTSLELSVSNYGGPK